MPLGWVLHDAVLVAQAGRPALALELLPLSLLAVAGGALFGLLARSWRLVLLAVLASGLWSLLPRLLGGQFTSIEAGLPRALFLMVVAFALARLLGTRRPGAMRLALLLGTLGCLLLVELRGVRSDPSWPVLACALAVVAVGFLPRAGLRQLATAAAVALPALWIAPGLREASRPSRPDLEPPLAAAPQAAPNLLLVILDTVRADHLVPYGYERETTPHLNRWVDEHFTVYENARSTSSWTLPSHASMFTGLFPAQHGAAPPGRYAQPIYADVPTLAEGLREAGYRTAGVMSNNVYLRAHRPDGSGQSYDLDRGFEHFDDRLAGTIGRYLTFTQLLGGDLRIGHLDYRDGGVITDLAIEWLDRRGSGPFFLALNYMDVHGPNRPPPPFDRLFSDERPGEPFAQDLALQELLYDRELAHVDWQLDRLLAALEERGLFENTAVLITSDHGEALGDHGLFWHGVVLYEALVHVPLYVKPPGGRSVERVAADISGADVFHLARSLLGFESAAGPEQAGLLAELYMGDPGPDLEPGADPPRHLFSFRQGELKFIVSTLDEVEAFDLRGDPHELQPVALTEAQIAAALERARAWWAAWPLGTAGEAELDEDELNRMRQLGYLDGDE